MKKFFVLFVMLIFISSCISDDKDSGSKEGINPPSWIIGEWGAKSDYTNSLRVLRFTSDDIILISSVNETSYKKLLNEIKRTGQEAYVEERTTNDSYDIIIHMGVTSTHYYFTRKDNNNITWKYNYIDNELIRM